MNVCDQAEADQVKVIVKPNTMQPAKRISFGEIIPVLLDRSRSDVRDAGSWRGVHPLAIYRHEAPYDVPLVTKRQA